MRTCWRQRDSPGISQWGVERGRGGGAPGSHSGQWEEVEGPQGSHWGVMEPGPKPEAELDAESSGVLVPFIM